MTVRCQLVLVLFHADSVRSPSGILSDQLDDITHAKNSLLEFPPVAEYANNSDHDGTFFPPLHLAAMLNNRREDHRLGILGAYFSSEPLFSNIKSASSLPGNDGSGICNTFSHSGISRAIQSAIVSFANAVKPLVF